METVVKFLEIAVTALIAFLSGRYLKTLDRHKERDKETFSTFSEKLPATGGILYIHNHDMAAGITFSQIQELFLFVEFSEDHPDFIFIDRSLEKKRQLLIDKLKVFLSELTAATETVRDEPLIIKLPQAHLHDDPNYWRETREKLNQRTSDVYELYSKLVIEAKKKL
jgi:hypothetical protein